MHKHSPPALVLSPSIYLRTEGEVGNKTVRCEVRYIKSVHHDCHNIDVFSYRTPTRLHNVTPFSYSFVTRSTLNPSVSPKTYDVAEIVQLKLEYAIFQKRADKLLRRLY